MVQQLAVSVGQCSERGRKARNQDFHGVVMPAGSALVIKGRFAHVFHVGDSRISRVADETLEPLTSDHRVVISSAESYPNLRSWESLEAIFSGGGIAGSGTCISRSTHLGV